MKNTIRIIGGQWRSRQLHFVEVPHLRPTPNRVRETLFNWLHYDITGSRCLDLYAGSGALGFEALSRGAQAVVQVENHPIACRILKENAQLLKTQAIKVIQIDALSYLAGQAELFDVVFLDPPFAQNSVLPTCQLLETNGWLAESAKIYIESENTLDLVNLPTNWQLLKSKSAGEVAYRLFERHTN